MNDAVEWGNAHARRQGGRGRAPARPRASRARERRWRVWR